MTTEIMDELEAIALEEREEGVSLEDIAGNDDELGETEKQDSYLD